VGKNNEAYFLQRAVEEMAAAERATSIAAAAAHRELSLRYSLKLILPEPTASIDEARVIGLPKPAVQRRAPVHSRRRSERRRQA
jgi:hypothetical protein